MRSLRLVVRTASGTLPLVVAASVSSAVACGKSERDDDSHGSASGNGGGGNGGAAQAGASSGRANGGAGQGGASGGTAGIIVVGGNPPTGGDGGTSGTNTCPAPQCAYMDIPLPPAGMPIEPGMVCAATVEPVESNRAASVTLQAASADLQMVTGSVAIAPEVTVLGTPIVEVMDATSSSLAALQISELVPAAGGGFSFQGTFPQPLPFNNADEGFERLTLRVTLEAACDGGSRQVHAVTDVHLCLVEGAVDWASSGEVCCVCRIIAEMAPSPIVPDKHADELPLAQALRLRIVELARVSNTIVLLAENDGGEGLDYEWLPSAGRIERLADDVIAWTLEEGTPDPFIQAAVYGKNAAAVASFAFNDRAA